MNTRRMGLVALAVLIMVSVAWSAARRPPANSAPTMAAAAKEFLASLSTEQRATASMAYDDPQRLGWHFIPKPFVGEKARKGLTIKAMSEPSRQKALALVVAGLSESGFKQARQIMELEEILGKMEGPMPKREWTRDPQMYYFTVFGEPGVGAWGWRCEGHHLSLNFMLDGDRLVSATPAFFGSNPAEVREGDLKGQRILERREDLARALLKSCDDEQKKIVWIDPKAPDDLRGGGDPQPALAPAVGLPAEKMTAEQRKLLRLTLEEYAQAMAPDIAAAWFEDLDKAGFERIQFAWWGGAERGDGHYYRLQGPTFLIEYNNTQNNANHVHSMWRSLRGDLGEKLAAQ